MQQRLRHDVNIYLYIVFIYHVIFIFDQEDFYRCIQYHHNCGLNQTVALRGSNNTRYSPTTYRMLRRRPKDRCQRAQQFISDTIV